MPEVPVKVQDGDQWVNTKIEAIEDRIKFSEPFNLEIPYKSIIDLSEKKTTLFLTVKGNPEVTYRIASVEKIILYLKRKIIINCGAYRIKAYFMSPAIRGGVLVTDAIWEKGAIAVVKTGIWFVSQTKQICVPLPEVTSIEITKRDVQNKRMEVIKIDHLENKDVVTSFVLCPLSTLQVLFNFLRDATKTYDMKGDELDSVGSQVSMLIYSGMDTKAIENMLNLTPKEIEDIYDKLLSLGMVDVVLKRREVSLTPKGVRYISEAVKPPTQ